MLIAGGADKGVDLSSMATDVERLAAVIAIGTTAPTIVEVFTAAGLDAARVVDVGTLGRAVSHAAAWAQPGDVVLLSPGCASLDQFANFEERGDAYRHLVAALADAPPTHSQEVSA